MDARRAVMTLSLALCAAVVGLPATAQTVYKCVATDGTPTFSQRPCSADPAQVTTIEVMPVGRADATAVARAAELSRTQHLDAERRACIARATEGHLQNSDDRIRNHRRRIADLEAQARRARNNLAGATWEAGLRQEMSALTAAISDEHSTRAAIIAAAQARCDEAHARALEQSP